LYATIVLVVVVGATKAGPFEDAVAAYEAGDYTAAYRLQRPLADQGFVKAQVNLGIMYAHGHGVLQDDVEAIRWFQKAADHGDPLAQHNLGVIYESGRGVPQDWAEAATWFRSAADQGLADAQYDLGRIYAEGRGIQQDYVRAYLWFSLAAAQGDRRALHNRSALVPLMTPAQIAEGRKLAREWVPKREP
jgi:TPR repeat protein